jgi:16S rRNA (guanine(1405)-N(7))-methyltransferase
MFLKFPRKIEDKGFQMKSSELAEKKEQVDQLVAAVLRSSKYRNVCASVIRNIGVHELSKRQNLKTAIKSTKNKLHQVGGAYFLKKPNYGVWLKKLRKAKKSANENLFRKACAEIMSYHYSTRERLNILEEFYRQIFSLLPSVNSIIDVACGFHPFSIPWMPISKNTKYYAYDIYRDMIDFLNEFMNIQNVQGYAEARDVIKNTPIVHTDLAFVLYTLPCLEQIEKSAGLKVLESINSNYLVVSYPVHSLGGRQKDMRKYYEARFNKIIQGKNWTVQQLEFSTELVFLITK